MSMQVPESMKSAWDAIAQKNTSGKITQEEYTALGDAANADANIDEQETAFLAYVETNYLNSASNVKQGSANPVNFVDTPPATYNISLNDVPQTLQSTWTNVTSGGTLDESGFEKLKAAAAPNKKNEEFDDGEINFISSLLTALQENNGVIGITSSGSPVSSPAASDGFNPPDSLKAAWEASKADGQITEDDMSLLVNAAAPTGQDSELDEGEFAFLSQVREQLNNGPINLNAASGNIEAAGNSGPVLLNWPGYTKETKAALKNAYGDLATGTKMPLLPKQYAQQVAAAFGQGSVQDLQKMIGAKVDGAFGPETFFKAKAFIANVMNSTNDPAVLSQVAGMLEALGNDPEVSMMKQKLSAPVNQPPVQNTEPKPEETQPEPVQLNLQTVDVNNKEAVAAFQSKLNILTSLLEKATGQELSKTPQDGTVTADFATVMSNFETVTGKNAEAAITEVEDKLKAAGHQQLDSKSARFIHFQSTGFEVIANPANLTRIESSKTLLSKVGVTLGSYDIQYPQNPTKDGDVQLVGQDFTLKIWDNFQKGRGHANYGDVHIEGDIAGKKVDLAYWENARHGESVTGKEGLYHIRLKVDGQEQHLRDNENGFLPKPLAR